MSLQHYCIAPKNDPMVLRLPSKMILQAYCNILRRIVDYDHQPTEGTLKLEKGTCLPGEEDYRRGSSASQSIGGDRDDGLKPEGERTQEAE